MPASMATRPVERRQVSVLFADTVGYTAIVQQMDEEKALHFTRMLYQRLAEAVQEHGGVVRSFAGDSVMAVFGIPEAQEDAALRACRAALAIQASFGAGAAESEARFGIRPSVRVGVSSGTAMMAPVEGNDAPTTAIGKTVNLASRIQALASDGGCLICDATRRQVEWLIELSFDGEHEIRGIARPQKLWQLISLREGAARFDVSLARGLSLHVGREEELKTLCDAFDRTEDRLCVMDVVAEAGLGKTRLVFECMQRAKTTEVNVLAGHCSADGRQVPFLPFLDVVRSSFRIRSDNEPAEIERKLERGLRRSGLDTPQNLGLLLNLLGLRPPEGALDGLDGVLIGLRTRDLLRAMLEAQCRNGRVVLLLEDIHWIDTASEEMLHNLINEGTQSNLLVIHTRRPEYLPGWRQTAGVAPLALRPLGATDIRHLVQARLGTDDLPEILVRQVIERAGGNPLFVEEILGFLADQGALRIEGGRAEFDPALGASALPASIHNLLAARIDRLGEADRTLLQAAAAIGRRFDPGLLALVADQPEQTGAALRRLQAHEIVHREADSSDYVFKHVLLRDAVYQSLASERRTELHLAIAGAIEQRNDGRIAEAAEILAYHYALTDRADLAFTYAAMAGAKSLGVFSLDAANEYFTAALALYRRDPACASDRQFAAFLADYALCLNLSLRVTAMIALAKEVGPILARVGDNHHHVVFLHHYVACLVCNARYLDALEIQKGLSAMAARLGDPASIAYALISEMSVSCYCAPFPIDVFEAKRRDTETALANVDDAYLQNFHLAIIGWNELCRGRVAKAHEAADRLIAAGVSMNDPRSLGYGTAMKALIAMVSDDHATALEMSEQALGVSRAEFEWAIASSARYAALVPLGKPGAIEDVKRYVTMCAENGWGLFGAGPDVMLGVALAMVGQIGAGIRHIEHVIALREREGSAFGADWNRLFLCEIYLGILSGEGDASLGVILRNLRTLVSVFAFGPKRIAALIEQVRSNPQFDPDGHYIARCELILGLLCKIRKKRDLAIRHLTEARRIVAPSGPSPMLTRIESALAELTGTPGGGHTSSGNVELRQGAAITP